MPLFGTPSPRGGACGHRQGSQNARRGPHGKDPNPEKSSSQGFSEGLGQLNDLCLSSSYHQITQSMVGVQLAGAALLLHKTSFLSVFRKPTLVLQPPFVKKALDIFSAPSRTRACFYPQDRLSFQIFEN